MHEIDRFKDLCEHQQASVLFLFRGKRCDELDRFSRDTITTDNLINNVCFRRN